MKVFLSYSFRKEDEALAAQLKEALGSFGLEIVTGKHLGGQNLEAEIKRRIGGVDGLVTLFSRRARAERNEATLDWVKAELAYARNHGKLAIVMIEKGVPLGGPEASNEYEVDPTVISPAGTLPQRLHWCSLSEISRFATLAIGGTTTALLSG